MLVELTEFRGELPRSDPARLPPGHAVTARDTRLENGTLTPVRARTFVTDLAVPRATIYLQGTTWVAFADPVSVVPGPIADDRLYIAGDGAPRLQLPTGASHALALPAPAAAPTISVLGAYDVDLAEDIFYAYTFVTSLGEESAPSPPSRTVTWSEGLAVRLSGFADPPANRLVTRIRIYRTQTGATGTTDLYFVDEIAMATDSYDHDLALTSYAEVLPSLDYDPPPPGLQGIIAMPNGMMVGHVGKRLVFCEPYLPHAWPRAYEVVVDYPIVGLAAFGTQLAVMTEGTPYRGQGTHPATFAIERIEERLPCLARRGIVDLGYAAAYPSTDGLVLITGAGASVVSAPLFTREQWRLMRPATMFAAAMGGRYVFACDGPIPRGTGSCAMLDLSGAAPFLIRTSMQASAFYDDFRTGTFYYQDRGDMRLYAWDEPDAAAWMAQDWRSAALDLPVPASFSAILVQGEHLSQPPDIAIEIHAGGLLLHTITTLDRPCRLPVAKSDRWQVRVTGRARIRSIKLATSITALAAGSS